MTSKGPKSAPFVLVGQWRMCDVSEILISLTIRLVEEDAGRFEYDQQAQPH